jgi:hypothetical protein
MIFSPGGTTAMNAAKFAWAPEWGWTLACSAPKSCFSRSMASCSISSMTSQPP